MMECSDELDEDFGGDMIAAEKTSTPLQLPRENSGTAVQPSNDIVIAQLKVALKESVAQNASLRARLSDSQNEQLSVARARDLLKSELDVMRLEVVRLHADNAQLRQASVQTPCPEANDASNSKLQTSKDGAADGLGVPSRTTASPPGSPAPSQNSCSSSISMRSFGDDCTGPGPPLKVSAPLTRTAMSTAVGTPLSAAATKQLAALQDPWDEDDVPPSPVVQMPAQSRTQSRKAQMPSSSRRSLPNCLTPRLISRQSVASSGGSTSSVITERKAPVVAPPEPSPPSAWPPWPETEFMRLDWVEPPAPEAMMKAVETVAFTLDREWERKSTARPNESLPRHFDKAWLDYRDEVLAGNIGEGERTNKFEPPQLLPDVTSCM